MPDYRSAAAWQFNIDKYLNRFIVPSLVKHLPSPVAHFMGYRTAPPHKIGNLIVIAWAFIGVFCGVSVVNVVNAHIPAFRADGGTTSITIGSFGAAAVLEFYAIEVPLAQPRNAVFGQVLSSLVGVAVARLFSLAGPVRFHTLRWLAGSIACAAATAVMALTGTVHPPAGATALIAVADENIYDIGWYLVPAVLLGSILMQCIALIINNIQRRYPIYWWSPQEVGQIYKRSPSKAETTTEPEKLEPTESSGRDESLSGPTPVPDVDIENGGIAKGGGNLQNVDPEPGHATFTRSRTLSSGLSASPGAGPEGDQIVITRNAVIVPDSLALRPEERLLLEALSKRL
ncbi:hpp family protein [Ophiostoma piceae UAMH 11346]|uniref:Hpp family protein n=1 Tax=Ophiostoma piceae (strain UAMH 11346) TaxID=1262450 RepID=S3BTF3_OPHP1|nr:hpp family protein [Ophiostoma piceae UAMH 11346]